MKAPSKAKSELELDDRMKELVQVAQEFLEFIGSKKLPSDSMFFFCVGDSPYWMLHTAALLDKFRFFVDANLIGEIVGVLISVPRVMIKERCCLN